MATGVNKNLVGTAFCTIPTVTRSFGSKWNAVEAKTGAGGWKSRSFSLLYVTSHAISHQFGAIPGLRAHGCKRPTVKRCIVSASVKTVFTAKAMVPQSFPTSLLPWFLNYDWQGGSVFPSAHPPLEHCGVKSTKAAKGRKWGVPPFKISAWIVKREVTQLKSHGLAASFFKSRRC